MSMRSDSQGVPLIFGEVLFDVFPGGEEVLGGAAFNAAWNLQGLGLAPLFLSRVGRDERGEKVLRAMTAWGMRTDGVQIDPEHPTGAVTVTVDAGQPSYTIVPNQAYDHIDVEEAAARVADESGALFYHGTLALRTEVSRDSAARLRDSLGLAVFMDVNLRAPWWSLEHVESFLSRTRWAKLNDDEVAALSPTPGPLASLAPALQERLGIEHLIVTRGAQGATQFLPDGSTLEVGASPVEKIEDTVGAGDAFSAVVVLGELKGWSREDTLRRAADYAAAVCGRRGATSAEPEVYSRWRERWG